MQQDAVQSIQNNRVLQLVLNQVMLHNMALEKSQLLDPTYKRHECIRFCPGSASGQKILAVATTCLCSLIAKIFLQLWSGNQVTITSDVSTYFQVHHVSTHNE